MDTDSDSKLTAGPWRARHVDDPRTPRRVAIVGAGRLGTALAVALRDAGIEVDGPLRRDDQLPDGGGAGAVLVCVPDAEIAAAASALPHDRPGLLVGHCSAATTLAALDGHEAFSLHPLMTVTGPGAAFAGATAAIAGTTPRALAASRGLALALGMRPVHVDDEDRAAYHAAASIASNFLVTLEGLAERMAASAGIEREPLVALVRASVENWAAAGASAALTGPIARGDKGTVRRQREAVAERLPDELELFDALTAATRRLAAEREDAAAPLPADASDDSAAAAGEIPPARPAMRTVRSIADLRAALAAPRRAGRRIGLVPTMGALHEGHLSLIRQARATCDVVVMTLFVNPAQFDEAADLRAYPRDEARDARLAAGAGADVLFAPPGAEIYPPGFATGVRVGGVAEPLEGEVRGAAHFAGVATVVTKLLNVAQPDVAFFGQKDAQQVAVIRRLVRDLDIPVTIEVGETVREPDGLALSSRNVRLVNGTRHQALALPRALDAARAAVHEGERDPARVVAAARSAMSELGVEPEYVELVSPDTFVPIRRVGGPRPVLVAVAARVGDVRLIDNALLQPASDPSTGSS